MHNYTAIFLAVDRFGFILLPVYFGIVYVLFSYAYARLPDSFPINMAPVYLVALLFACYFGLWGMSLLTCYHNEETSLGHVLLALNPGLDLWLPHRIHSSSLERWRRLRMRRATNATI